MSMHDVEILRAACCVAGLDEKITDDERAILQRLADHAGVGKVSLTAIIERGRTDPFFFEKQFEILKTDPTSTLSTLIDVACADGQILDAQRVVLQHFADALGLPDDKFQSLLAEAQQKINPPSE